MIQILFDKAQPLEIPAACTISRGDSLSLSVRRTWDKTRVSQDISRRRFKMAPTWSVTYTLTQWHDLDLLSRVYQLEDAVGKTGDLIENNVNHGCVVVKSASFALSVDADGIIKAVQVNLSLLSGRVPLPRNTYEVRTL